MSTLERWIASQSTAKHKIRDHNRALARPQPGFERAIADMVRGLTAYQAAYAERYRAKLSTDTAIADDWLSVARGIVGLLDGDTGRFHCPTLEGVIRASAQQAGFSITLQPLAQKQQSTRAQQQQTQQETKGGG